MLEYALFSVTGRPSRAIAGLQASVGEHSKDVRVVAIVRVRRDVGLYEQKKVCLLFALGYGCRGHSSSGMAGKEMDGNAERSAGPPFCSPCRRVASEQGVSSLVVYGREG